MTHYRERVGISGAEAITGIRRTKIWHKYKNGTLPAPHYIGDRRMWFVDELEAWAKAEMARPSSSRRGGRNLGAAAQPKGQVASATEDQVAP